MSPVHPNTFSFTQQLHRQVLVAVPCKTAKHEIGHLTFTLLGMIMKCKGMIAASDFQPSELMLQVARQTELHAKLAESKTICVAKVTAWQRQQRCHTCDRDSALLEATEEGVVLIGFWGPWLSHHWQLLFFLCIHHTSRHCRSLFCGQTIYQLGYII